MIETLKSDLNWVKPIVVFRLGAGPKSAIVARFEPNALTSASLCAGLA